MHLQAAATLIAFLQAGSSEHELALTVTVQTASGSTWGHEARRTVLYDCYARPTPILMAGAHLAH